jgi:hypothetical protein
VSAPPGVPQLPRTPRTTHTGVGHDGWEALRRAGCRGRLTLALVSNDEAPDTQLLYVCYAGGKAARRYLELMHGATAPAASAALAETLVWWGALDDRERGREMGSYTSAMESEGLTAAAPGLRLARANAVHAAVLTDYNGHSPSPPPPAPGDPPGVKLWGPTDAMKPPRSRTAKQRTRGAEQDESYRTHLEGRDSGRTAFALKNVFDLSMGAQPEPTDYAKWFRQAAR